LLGRAISKKPFSVLQPAAMFNVLNKDPPIPDNLSQEGKDFLRCCLKRNPAKRLRASELLNHPFVQNSSHDSKHVQEVITTVREEVMRTSCHAPLKGKTTTW
jgi:serine/threonine protein kinase